ncbi:hypothetical protein Tco_0308214 [Tanacetum coccineum]
MGNNIEEWYIMPEGEAFDLSVYETYTDYFSIKFHYAQRFTDSRNKHCVDGEFACVDMVNNADFRIDLLNSVLCSLDTSDEDGEGDSKHDSEDGHCDANDIIDEEHLVDEVEVNMSAFNFQIDGEGEDGQVDSIQPLVTVIEDFLEVLDNDSLECD